MSWLPAVFRQRTLERELDAELRFLFDQQIKDNLAAGMSPEEARRAAAIEFGGLEQVKETCRDERSGQWLETLLHDLRYAVRQLRKTPGFTSVVILSLALGIGANTAIFSLVNEVLLKSLPVKNPDELVVFRHSGRIMAYAPRWINGNGDHVVDSITKEHRNNAFSPVVFARLQEKSTALSDVFAFSPMAQLNAVIDDMPEIVPLGQIVSGNYYAGLGVPALLGRTLTPADDQPAATAVAVISHRYWQRRFNREPAVVGKTIWLNTVPVTIVGVTPANFSGTLQVGEAPDFSVPLALAPRLRPERASYFERQQPSYWWLRIIGRLQRGATREQVRAQLEGAFQQVVLEAFPNTDMPLPGLRVEPGDQGLDEARRTYRQSLLILTGLVGLVLTIACVNVTNLLLARAAARRKEIAVRLALGAGRGRVVRQLLTESLLLSLLGGGLGALFAWWGKDLLLALQPAALPSTSGSALVLDLAIDGRGLAFTIAVAIATGILFGLIPALRATRVDLNAEFQGGARTRGSVSRSRLAKSLMVAQVALSLVLLIGAGLFTRTLRNLQRVDAGFDRGQLLLFRLDAEAAGRDRMQTAALYREVRERVAALPGVRASTFSMYPLLASQKTGGGGSIFGYKNGPGVAITIGGDITGVGPDFFKTIRIPVLLGREFDFRDTTRAAEVVVINQKLVRKVFGDENPIGKRTTFGEIVGVVADAHYDDLKNSVEPTAYVPFQQMRVLGGQGNFAVRTDVDSRAVLASVRGIVRQIDPKLPLFDVRTQEEQVARLLQQERLFAQLAGFFGLLALGLVCVGLYGLMSYAVLQRTGEIGIRVALGALPRSVQWMILRESLALVCVGVVVGVAGAWAASRLIAKMLYGLSPTDPVTYGGVALLLIAVALLACLLPARRASKVDPMVALRCE
ncbi:MAG: ABC transporter permease [Verrucomicrobia bacterium]|nr:ABC transporter permease [Verrucomicrobiota bacterium]